MGGGVIVAVNEAADADAGVSARGTPSSEVRGIPGSMPEMRADTSTIGEKVAGDGLISLDKPSDALAEYQRLTGLTVMPPKWALGYLQSHRTLAGPNEITQIAKTFRDKQLPCDALIYLGTGYCPAGWNVGHGSVAFNPKTFDHPAEMVQGLHDLNFRVVLHVNHAPRELFGASVREASDVPTHIHNYWARHRDTFRLGVDGWWPDDGDELPIEARPQGLGVGAHPCFARAIARAIGKPAIGGDRCDHRDTAPSPRAQSGKEWLDGVDRTQQIDANLTCNSFGAFRRTARAGARRGAGIRHYEIHRRLSIELAQP